MLELELSLSKLITVIITVSAKIDHKRSSLRGYLKQSSCTLGLLDVRVVGNIAAEHFSGFVTSARALVCQSLKFFGNL